MCFSVALFSVAPSGFQNNDVINLGKGVKSLIICKSLLGGDRFLGSPLFNELRHLTVVCGNFLSVAPLPWPPSKKAHTNLLYLRANGCIEN